VGNLDHLKAKLKATKETLEPDHLSGSEHDILRPDTKELQDRFETCQTANDVFTDFSRDAAKQVALGMYAGRSSQDRLRAANTILDRALGKPVDRTISARVEIAAMSNEELDYQIKYLMEELGNVDNGTAKGILLGERNKEIK